MSIAQDENGKESRALKYHSVPIDMLPCQLRTVKVILYMMFLSG